MNEKNPVSGSRKPSEAEETSAELMYVKCAVCGKWMDVKPGHINGISHSFCTECYTAEMRKLNTDKNDSKAS